MTGFEGNPNGVPKPKGPYDSKGQLKGSQGPPGGSLNGQRSMKTSQKVSDSQRFDN